MPTVKTAISIREPLFEQVNELAKELQIPRSQLISLAVEEFIERHENRRLFDALNEVYSEEPNAEELALRDLMRRKRQRLVEGEW